MTVRTSQLRSERKKKKQNLSPPHHRNSFLSSASSKRLHLLVLKNCLVQNVIISKLKIPSITSVLIKKMSSNITRLLKDRSKPIEQRAAEVAELLPSIGDNLQLNGNSIGDEGAKALSTALPMMTSLVTLELRNTNIGD